ncbi:MAG: hypothetical protein K6F05_01140 [Succinivibrio sp.]|nr:hypothetical protein [Succinivibrio sp.]
MCEHSVFKAAGLALTGALLLTACSSSTQEGMTQSFAERIAAARFQQLLPKVNNLVNFDWADEETIRLANECSLDAQSSECNGQYNKLAEVYAALRQRCFKLSDGKSCNLGTLFANHLKSKIIYFDPKDEDYFALEALRMAKQGCSLKYAASCDDYGFAFLSEDKNLQKLAVPESEIKSSAALGYFKQSCEGGYAGACERLHYLYTQGELNSLKVKVNPKEAEKYLRIGCKTNPQGFINRQLCSTQKGASKKAHAK